MSGLSGQVGDDWSPNVVAEHPKALVRVCVLTFGKSLLVPIEMKGHIAAATEAVLWIRRIIVRINILIDL